MFKERSLCDTLAEPPHQHAARYTWSRIDRERKERRAGGTWVNATWMPQCCLRSGMCRKPLLRLRFSSSFKRFRFCSRPWSLVGLSLLTQHPTLLSIQRRGRSSHFSIAKRFIQPGRHWSFGYRSRNCHVSEFSRRRSEDETLTFGCRPKRALARAPDHECFSLDLWSSSLNITPRTHQPSSMRPRSTLLELNSNTSDRSVLHIATSSSYLLESWHHTLASPRKPQLPASNACLVLVGCSNAFCFFFRHFSFCAPTVSPERSHTLSTTPSSYSRSSI